MEVFDRDREEVIRRAKSRNVEGILVSGYDSLSNHRALDLVDKGVKGIYITLGLSPNMRNGEDVGFVERQIIENQERISAVGEIGLDRVKSLLSLEKQKEIFKRMLNVAKDIDKPVVIHARSAENIAIDILKRYDLPVMLHCFTGSLKSLKRAEDLGYTISISTMVCFVDKVERIVKEANESSIVVESDSPFLSPVRGRNEPANIIHAVEEISRIKEVKKEEILKITKTNTEKFFRI
jgi:TatD DNase family protein